MLLINEERCACGLSQKYEFEEHFEGEKANFIYLNVAKLIKNLTFL